MDKVIVSRHPAAVQFVAAELGGVYEAHLDQVRVGGDPLHYHTDDGWVPANGGDCIPVLAQAGPADVAGKVVYGNLPLHLAAMASEVWAIEFEGAPPRGQEYTLADMRAAGARLVPYKVLGRPHVEALRELAHGDGYGPDPWCLIHFADETNPYADLKFASASNPRE